MGAPRIPTTAEQVSIVIGGEIPFLNALLRMALLEAGFKIKDEAATIEDLERICKALSTTVVLIDFQMSEEDGVKLTNRLLDIDSALAIVFIIETLGGFGEKVLASGARAFIQKPFSTFDLVDLIRKVAPVHW